MWDPQEKENRKKKSRRHDFKIDNSMVKHITGYGISKHKEVEVKPHPGATTDNIVDSIRSTIRQKPDIFVIHSGTNYLTKDVNTIIRVSKL